MTYKNWITIPNLENRYSTHYPILKEKRIEIVALTVLSFFLIKMATVMSLFMLMSPKKLLQNTIYEGCIAIGPLVSAYCHGQTITHTDTDRQTDRQTDRHTDTQTHTHTDRQTHTHTQKHTHTHTHTNTNFWDGIFYFLFHTFSN